MQTEFLKYHTVLWLKFETENKMTSERTHGCISGRTYHHQICWNHHPRVLRWKHNSGSVLQCRPITCQMSPLLVGGGCRFLQMQWPKSPFSFSLHSFLSFCFHHQTILASVPKLSSCAHQFRSKSKSDQCMWLRLMHTYHHNLHF